MLHKHTATKNITILVVIAIVTGECTMLILQKYGFKVCVISFDFYSTHYKVYIHLPCINSHRRTTAPFVITHVISSSNLQTPILYQGSDDCYEGYRNSGIIFLLQPSQKINYCNQSVLAIVPDLNILIWSIVIFYFISRSALVQFFYITCYKFVMNWIKIKRNHTNLKTVLL